MSNERLSLKCRVCDCRISQADADAGDALVEGMGCETMCEACARHMAESNETDRATPQGDLFIHVNDGSIAGRTCVATVHGREVRFTPAEPAPKKMRGRRKLAAVDSTGAAGLEHFLRERQEPYVAVDEAKKAIFAGSNIGSFNFLVYRQDGPNHLVLIVHGKPTTEQDERLAEWERVFGPAFVGVFVCRRASGWQGRTRTNENWMPYLTGEVEFQPEPGRFYAPATPGPA